MITPLLATLFIASLDVAGASSVLRVAGPTVAHTIQPRYVYSVLTIEPDPALPNFLARDVLDNGEMVGDYFTSDREEDRRAARWSHGRILLVLESPFQAITVAQALNERRTVIGRYFNPSDGYYYPCAWKSDGTFEEVEVPPGTTGLFVGDLNGLDWLVGSISNSTGSDAVIWRDGKIVKIPRFPGCDRNDGSQISDNGIVMGGSFQGKSQFPWLWSERRGLYLDTDDQGRRLQAQWLNAKGDYAGLSSAGAMRRIGSTVTYFEPRPAVATRLNERGDALGYDVNDRLVVWPFEGGKIDVEASLDRSSGYVRLYDAPVAGFNNHGQIVVVAIRADGTRRQVLLTPQSAGLR